ncbi:MAG: fimbrillin family protein [Bacteroidales bacterium]|nr:fimbrillin family protein [Bacteroidales bacterium]
MKKFLFIAAMASVALVSCVKNEVIPVNEEGQEITYLTSPVTKADFGATNVFASWAFFTPTDWATDKATAAVYDEIGGVTISKNTSGEWKEDEKSHYWPKAGKLSFFAYSLNNDDLKNNSDAAMTGIFTCTAANGITATGYDVNTDKNVDFLVAKPIKDATRTTDNYLTNGVPTVFEHKLAQVVFTIQTAADYSATQTFKLNSITLKNLETTGTYTQLASPTWSNHSGEVVTTSFSNTETNFGNSVVTPAAAQSLYLPQDFDDNETVTISYTVTPVGGGAPVTYAPSTKLSEIFTSGWTEGTIYTCAITVGLEEIKWNPSVAEWASETGSWSIN